MRSGSHLGSKICWVARALPSARCRCAQLLLFMVKCRLRHRVKLSLLMTLAFSGSIKAQHWVYSTPMRHGILAPTIFPVARQETPSCRSQLIKGQAPEVMPPSAHILSWYHRGLRASGCMQLQAGTLDLAAPGARCDERQTREHAMSIATDKTKPSERAVLGSLPSSCPTRTSDG
jgi:hypothetical protein